MNNVYITTNGMTKEQKFVDFIFKKYKNGFYVHLPKESGITNKQKIAKYVARYIRHPDVANSKICGYDGDLVSFLSL